MAVAMEEREERTGRAFGLLLDDAPDDAGRFLGEDYVVPSPPEEETASEKSLRVWAEKQILEDCRLAVSMDAEIDALDRHIKALTARKRTRQGVRERARAEAAELMRTYGVKKVKRPDLTVSHSEGKPKFDASGANVERIEKFEADLVFELGEQYRFVVVEKKVDARALKAYFEETGELPPGCAEIPGKDSITIRV